MRISTEYSVAVIYVLVTIAIDHGASQGLGLGGLFGGNGGAGLLTPQGGYAESGGGWSSSSGGGGGGSSSAASGIGALIGNGLSGLGSLFRTKMMFLGRIFSSFGRAGGGGGGGGLLSIFSGLGGGNRNQGGYADPTPSTGQQPPPSYGPPAQDQGTPSPSYGPPAATQSGYGAPASRSFTQNSTSQGTSRTLK